MNSSIPMAWFNGRLRPASEPVISLDDRGVLLGDALFETVPVRNGRPFAWEAHIRRLEAGAQLTGIRPGLSRAEWTEALEQLLRANEALNGTVRLTVTRGVGRRGYSPNGADKPNRFLTWHPGDPPGVPHPGWRLRTSGLRLAADDPLGQVKHGSRLLNVLARGEAEAAGADEALLLDTDGKVVEAASGTVFWISGDQVHTPAAGAALPGITARQVAALLQAEERGVVPCPVTLEGLAKADAAFLTLSTLGVVPVTHLDGRPMGRHWLVEDLARRLDLAMESGVAPAP